MVQKLRTGPFWGNLCLTYFWYTLVLKAMNTEVFIYLFSGINTVIINWCSISWLFQCCSLHSDLTSYSHFLEALFHAYLRECEVVQTRFLLQGSRKLNYKGLVRDCLTIMCGLCQIQSAFSNDEICLENYVAKPSGKCDTAVAIALPEIGKNTCIAMQKLLILVSSETSFSSG